MMGSDSPSAPMSEAQEIAGKLTEAQRRVLLSSHDTLFGNRKITSAHMDPRVRANLQRMGLTEAYDWHRDTLTPVGLAVRALATRKDIPNV